MKNLYCVIFSKYKKFDKLKILYLLEKTLVLPITCIKCENEDEKLSKEKESINMLKSLLLYLQ